jgi:hypothetical protein
MHSPRRALRSRDFPFRELRAIGVSVDGKILTCVTSEEPEAMF